MRNLRGTLAGALLTGPHRSAAMDDADLVPPALPGSRSGKSDRDGARDEAA